VIEQDYADFSAVVLVNDSCTHADAVLEGESGPRGDAGVGVRRACPGESCVNQGVLPGRNCDVLAGAEVIASCQWGALLWVFGIFVELLHEELATHFPPKNI
jgi:hypothetical protein